MNVGIVTGNALRGVIVDFVRTIGIEVRAAELPGDCFLPGLDIAHGAILFDEARWLYPGDLLHEAGHLAVAAPEARGAAKLSPTPGDEMASIAWSYAAAVALALPLDVLFHADGYRGGSQALIDAFQNGGYIGLPLLQCYGMALEPKNAIAGGPAPYPHMLRWLR